MRGLPAGAWVPGSREDEFFLDHLKRWVVGGGNKHFTQQGQYLVTSAAVGGLWTASRCLEAGMDDVLTKPFSQEQLADTLRRWLPDPPTT